MPRILEVILTRAARLSRTFSRALRREDGNVGPLGALMIVPLLGALSLAIEGGTGT
ncbi:hypothetical protein [Brevundimonas naejangsanensis]|uniref:hypothetical protein n=1 Tax=Brevundimonas naejangsanensis TaxID=588932 RepID=UPI0013C4A06C|nr:hypothetical protein [Brevundimonas naejangsanensis]